MKPALAACLLSFLLFSSCKNSSKKAQNSLAVSAVDTLKKQKSKLALKKKPTPVFGYRFVITGDFDGDGKKEKLVEHYFSKIDHRETNKFYENLDDYDQLIKLTIAKKPYSFLSSDNKKIKDLPISSSSQLGLAYMKNEGDLDGDGGDEISYVVDWTDWSNINGMSIMTYKHGKWIRLYSFEMWDWQLPDLPQTYNQYGLGRRENKIINTTNDTANRKIEQNLHDFKGLIKKVANNRIRIIHIGDDLTMDTTVVNLKRRSKRSN